MHPLFLPPQASEAGTGKTGSAYRGRCSDRGRTGLGVEAIGRKALPSPRTCGNLRSSGSPRFAPAATASPFG